MRQLMAIVDSSVNVPPDPLRFLTSRPARHRLRILFSFVVFAATLPLVSDVEDASAQAGQQSPVTLATPDTPESEYITRLRSAAEEGDAPAQLTLGMAYAAGDGVAQDHAIAVDWFRKSAGKGYAPAQYLLGNSYARGRGVPKEDLQAVAWLRKAADQGHPFAQNDLGAMYENGIGVAQDYVQAVAWYRKAAEPGSIPPRGLTACSLARSGPMDRGSRQSARSAAIGSTRVAPRAGR